MSAVHEKANVPVADDRADHSSQSSDLNNKEEDLENIESIGTTFTNTQYPGRRAQYEDGNVVLQPAPSADPKDPLNLSNTRKAVALVCLAVFGAMAAAAEIILGAMLPVFALVYANIDPKLLVPITRLSGGFPEHSNPLAYLNQLSSEYPITDIYLLASLPVLVIGLANFTLVPAAVAVGRRPVLLFSGVVAIAGAVWAGKSTSLGTHLGARCLQAVGAGTVEGLIPFIIQDMVFVHQRNTWISAIFAMQGLLIIGLGIAAPYVIIALDWRWMYFITAIVAGVFLLGLFFFVPETRWARSRSEMDGIPRVDTAPPGSYAPRTLMYDIQIFHGKSDWKKGWFTFYDSLRTFFYPNIFLVTMLSSAMIGSALAAAYTVAPALLTAPWTWDFYNLGLCLVPVLVAAVCVGVITGQGGDWLANYFAKKNGERAPEVQILNLILPCIASIVGSVIYGVAGSDQTKYPWIMFVIGLGLMAFGFLGTNSVASVYVLECFPHTTGTALMNIAAVRAIVAFLFSFRVAEFVAELGYFRSMMIYTGLIAGFTLPLPLVYFYGAAWRRWLKM